MTEPRRCPTCDEELPDSGAPRAATVQASPTFPYCSDRCRLVDLNRWLSGDFVIPGDPMDPEDTGQDNPRA